MWDLHDNVSTYCLCIRFTTPENTFMCCIYRPLSYYSVAVNGISSNGLFSLAINAISLSEMIQHYQNTCSFLKSQLPLLNRLDIIDRMWYKQWTTTNLLIFFSVVPHFSAMNNTEKFNFILSSQDLDISKIIVNSVFNMYNLNKSLKGM